MDAIIKAIKKGEVVICPTDTVYGIIADEGNKKAVERIYRIKKRPKSKPLAVFVKDLKMAKSIAEISEKQEKILKKYWPGKYTFILKAKAKKTIAIRIPNYKFLNDLLKKINKPLVQTSANISGKPPTTKIAEVLSSFKNLARSDLTKLLIIDAGDLPKRKPSKIIDLTGKNEKVLRY